MSNNKGCAKICMYGMTSYKMCLEYPFMSKTKNEKDAGITSKKEKNQVGVSGMRRPLEGVARQNEKTVRI